MGFRHPTAIKILRSQALDKRYPPYANPGPEGPWRSMRFEAQRAGAEEWELLAQALRAAPEETEELIRGVCSDFRTYVQEGRPLRLS